MAVLRSMFSTTPKVAPSATSSSALQNISASIAGSDSTTAQRAPNRASNGSISVVNACSRIVRAKNSPPRIRLIPKHTPPWSPVATLDR